VPLPGVLETAAIWFNHGGIHVGENGQSQQERLLAEVIHHIQ